MRFLGEKTTNLVFPATTVARLWNGASDALFFFNIWGGQRIVSAPLNFKKGHALGPDIAGPSAGRWFIGAGVGPGCSPLYVLPWTTLFTFFLGLP